MELEFAVAAVTFCGLCATACCKAVVREPPSHQLAINGRVTGDEGAAGALGVGRQMSGDRLR
jgi:hypothetical protein